MPSLENVLDKAIHSSWFGHVDTAEISIIINCNIRLSLMQGWIFIEKTKSENTEVGTMDQNGHGGSLFPVCKNKDVCVGDEIHNWRFGKMRPILYIGIH